MERIYEVGFAALLAVGLATSPMIANAADLQSDPEAGQLVFAPVRQNATARSGFPTTNVTADLLDDFADQQSAKDKALEAKKAELKARQEQLDKEAAEKLAADERAREKAIADREAAKKAKEEKAAAAAAMNAEKRAKNTYSGDRYVDGSAKKIPPALRNQDSVKRVDRRAERIAAREAAGEDKPEFFFQPGSGN
jgi:Skp family chaperone for outer membrane proteins